MFNHYRKFKIVLLGDSGVGKSSIILRFFKNKFLNSSESTIGAAFFQQNLNITHSGKSYLVDFQVWDTAGQERYHSLTPMYTRDADGIILMFDNTNVHTLRNITRVWLNQLKNDNNDLIGVLVGNKNDLHIDIDYTHILCKLSTYFKSVEYFSTSAKSGDGVDKMFNYIIGELIDISNCKPNTDDQITPAKLTTSRISNCCGGY